MRAIRTSRRDKGDGLPGAGSDDVGGEENCIKSFLSRWDLIQCTLLVPG